MWYDCKGCTMFSCVAEITHIMSFGEPGPVNRWFLNHFQKYCTRCGGENLQKSYWNRDVDSERLRCKVCHATSGVFTGLPFSTCRLDPYNIVLVLFFFCRGVSQSVTASFTSLTPYQIRSVIRSVIELICAYNFEEYLAANHGEVQCDETAVGNCKPCKNAMGRSPRKDGTIWVAGMVSVGKDQVRKMLAHVVLKRDANTLCKFIEDATKADARVVTDGWRAYTQVRRQHVAVNHSVSFVNSEGAHTNNIECAWRYLKKQIRCRWGTIGTEDLDTCNGRVQAGVFFVNCSLSAVDPFRLLLAELRRSEELIGLLKTATTKKPTEEEESDEEEELDLIEAEVEARIEAEHEALISRGRSFMPTRVPEEEAEGKGYPWVVVGARCVVDGKRYTVVSKRARSAVLTDEANNKRRAFLNQLRKDAQ